jgi:hypothetical protein
MPQWLSLTHNSHAAIFNQLGYEGWLKNATSAPPTTVPVTVNFADLAAVGWTSGSASVRDLWKQADLGKASGSFTAQVAVPGQ